MSDASAPQSNSNRVSHQLGTEQSPAGARCGRHVVLTQVRKPMATAHISKTCGLLTARATLIAILIGTIGAAHAGDAQLPPGKASTGPAWASLPSMQVEAYYRAPLADTMIQRLRDPIDGSVCFLYVPIEAQHSRRGTSGYVSYGSNTIGSLSCFPNPESASRPPPAIAAASTARQKPGGTPGVAQKK